MKKKMENIRCDIQMRISGFREIFSVPKFVLSIDYINNFYPHLFLLQCELWDKVYEKVDINREYVQMNWYNVRKTSISPHINNKP